MILVTLGTQKQSFKRLLDYIEKSNIEEEIIVQAGYTKYESKKMKIMDFVSYEEMDNLINKADIIITHGGTGSIIGPLKKGKKVIACARLKKYKEHVDDHQEEVVEALTEQGYILKLDETSNLSELLKKIKNKKPKKYISNTDKFKKKLEQEIDLKDKKGKLSKTIFNNIYIFCFFSAFLVLDLFSRYFYNDINNFIGNKDLIPNLFTLSYVSMFFLLYLLLNKKNKKRFLIIMLFIFNFIFIIVAIFYNLFQYAPSFSDLVNIKEGALYAKEAIFYINFREMFIIGLSILLGFLTYYFTPVKNGSKNKYLICAIIIISVFSYNFALFKLNSESDENGWAIWRNKKEIYTTFYDAKRAYMVSGFYNYVFKDFYLTFLHENEINKEQALLNVDNYINNNFRKHNDNEFTGILKNKNLIFVLMETIEDWMISKENMPTLYKMMKEGINFTNHFSPNFVAGHTFNSEFTANTSLHPFGEKTILSRVYSNNDFSFSLPNMFKKEGYIVNSYHQNARTFYNRDRIHLNFGYTKYYDGIDLQLKSGFYSYDSHLVKDGYEKIVSDKNFMSFIITFSAHMPYNLSKEICNSHFKKVKEYINTSSEEYLCAMAQSYETDLFFHELLNKLKKDNKLDNTVIIGFTDHYAYGLGKELLYELKGEKDSNMLQKTPFFVWSNDIPSYQIKKVTNTSDILPTILNLFDMEWNPNYYAGNDALDPEYDGFVFFKDFSWYDGKIYYKIDGDFKNYDYDEEYINSVNKKIIDLVKFNENILLSDYYKNKR